MSKEIKIGLIGAGWMGKAHTTAFHNARMIFGDDMPVFELVSDVSEDAVAKFAKNMGYNRYTTNWMDVVTDPAIDLVDVATPNCMHYEMAKAALEHGKHVFCEKPLADTVEKCKEAEQIIAAHPELTFMLGFMRRYDHSYQVAKKKMENGDIGDVILVRCYSQDPIAIIKGTLEYAPRSGGQFIDMSIHDIDLIRWLTESEPKKLWAIGGCYEFKQYKDWDDGDNVSCLIQNENETMAFFYAGRAAAHGSAVETEIVGTRGTLRISAVPTDSLLEVMSEHGVCRECYQDFVTRWHDAYVKEMEVFCDNVATGTPANPNVYDGTKSTNIAFRCKESFLKNELLTLSE